MDWRNIAWWTCLIVGISPALVAFLWRAWSFDIRPRMIPQEEIERLAKEMRRKRLSDPEYAAFLEEHAAWQCSDAFGQGKWRRVRQLLRNRP